MLYYRLKSAIVGIERSTSEDKTCITQIPDGAVLSLPDPGRDSGIIEVQFEGRRIGIFLQDLRARGERLRSEGA